MASTYTYLVLMPAIVLLASVNSVNSNHIGSQCLLAVTRSDTLNIDVDHRSISWGATFRCYQMRSDSFKILALYKSYLLTYIMFVKACIAGGLPDPHSPNTTISWMVGSIAGGSWGFNPHPPTIHTLYLSIYKTLCYVTKRKSLMLPIFFPFERTMLLVF